MLDEVDPFDFVLAESLGKHLTEIRALPQREIVEWKAFYKYRNAQQELAQAKNG